MSLIKSQLKEDTYQQAMTVQAILLLLAFACLEIALQAYKQP